MRAIQSNDPIRKKKKRVRRNFTDPEEETQGPGTESLRNAACASENCDDEGKKVRRGARVHAVTTLHPALTSLLSGVFVESAAYVTIPLRVEGGLRGTRNTGDEVKHSLMGSRHHHPLPLLSSLV